MTEVDNGSVPAATIDAIKAMSQADAAATLKVVLRAAVKLEMATIPIYLYTYYSICRRPGLDMPNTGSGIPANENFPATSSLYGNEAGATIMSVAVEEMLHMSLAMNLLSSTLADGEMLPQIYDGLTFGDNGIILPDLNTLTMHTGGTPAQPIETITNDPLEIPLAKLSLDQLQQFMRIEYPGKKNSLSPVTDPEGPDWATIGEVYDYAKALINYGNGNGGRMPDSVFANAAATQIGSHNYSASNIDTLSSGKNTFTFVNPPVVGTNNPPDEIAASTVAVFENDDNDDHTEEDALFRISTAQEALDAINTILEQGEGSDFTQYVTQTDMEESHYYKFWSLTGALADPGSIPKPPAVSGITAPPMEASQITNLGERYVYNFPTNPKKSDYSAAAGTLVDVANGLFQYMLIMSETTLLVPASHQKLYFNKTMHQSMIWVMDKLYKDIRNVTDNGKHIVPTFENPFSNGTTRQTAFAGLQLIVGDCQAKASNLPGYSSVSWIMDLILALPDVSAFWDGNTGKTHATLPSYLTPPTIPSVTPEPCNAGTATTPGTVNTTTPVYEKYNGTQSFPGSPPTDAMLNASAGTGNWVRHACMGLNSCKNQGRTLDNSCAGQGWCSTALAYNAADPGNPGLSDHTCHVKNNCAGQGGCGLYGTEDELNHPGGNSCQAQGSCATPINAERFITEGDNRSHSVWKQAREHFQTTVWPTLDASNQGADPLPADGANYPANEALFADGPTIEWIKASGKGMTACGSSGMSGAGSCG